MSIINTVNDVNNTFLLRRELTCNFAGLAGKLQKLEAVNMITKEFKLEDKVVIPMRLQCHVGKPLVTGTFYVYDDENLAKKHINPIIFSRLEKSKAKLADVQASEQTADASAEDTEVKTNAASEIKEEGKSE
ncbi:MAG: hypothetical protein OEL69_05115 [Nitrosopumilus sp.]|nr:hypothetical protein [Nitrosopumilus sp.]